MADFLRGFPLPVGQVLAPARWPRERVALAAARAMLSHPSFRLAGKDMAGTSLGIGAWGWSRRGHDQERHVAAHGGVHVAGGVRGSAQLAVLPLLMVGAPLWVVWLTAARQPALRHLSMWRSYFEHLPLRWRLATSYFSGDVILWRS